MAKRYSSKVKFQMVLEVIGGQQTVAQAAKAYGVHPNSINAWKQEFLDRGPEVFAQDSAAADYEQRIAKLERLLGQKEVEIALLKNFLGRNE